MAVCCTLVAAGSCSKKNPLYCDKPADCSGTLDFCDYEGLEGLGKTCIEDPQDQSCNLAQPCEDGSPCKDDTTDGLPGICVECVRDRDCPNGAPTCDLESNTCLTPSCELGNDGDDFCMSETPMTPVCGPNGRCAECNENADCMTPPQPACDTETGECRGCQAHAECDSGACDLDNGMCIDQANIVYVDDNGTNGVNCGTINAPCRTFSEAGGAGGAIVKIKDSVRTIVLQPGALNDKFSVNGLDLTIIGEEGSSLAPVLNDLTPAVSVFGGATVTFSSMILAKTSHNAESIALRCAGNSTIKLEDSQVDEVATGIVVGVTGCDLTLLRSEVRGSQGIGVSIQSGSLDMQQSKITDNDEGGLFIESADFSIVNSLIADNGSGGDGSDFGGIKLGTNLGSQRLEHTTIARNRVGDLFNMSVGSGLDCFDGDLNGQNNIIAFAGSSNMLLVTGCTLTNSLVEVSPIYPGQGNINGSPTFAAVDDFHLAEGSAGVDEAVGDEVKIDLDGDARPQGLAPDMGMDEVTVD
jgi:hypothetical protein